MPFRTINQYFDIEDGTEIENWTKVKDKYTQIKKTKNAKFDNRTGWWTITWTRECERTKQLKLL